MTRGFTLLELVITMSVCGVVLAFAAPNFSKMIESSKMQRLATELNGFLIQARSEAVMRNEALYAHISFLEGTVNTTGSWSIVLADSDDLSTAYRIAHFDGSPYKGIKLTHTFSSQQVSFEEIRGRPKSGSFVFHPKLDSTNKIAIRTSNPPGRIRVCGVEGDRYGYKAC
ncbi:GspH/FimT family pseudopilin [Vibrio genomosp. F10]|uniref:Type II secretion system protein H n=2 Tax=Vibrio genomosp. F10 TaxID=723171 RepID=A0A1B9QT70_9VIBR|nr:GspH/FimT family pseudopilin [Vibrio genomosp. F10]OCH69547.1 type IV pilin [Vibrio genomosp. F10]OEE34420.1 type IV pilin [Vibrio genomosp. F10 str. ZF-129]OEF04912.1 type IV pilin [Vibrio genomosp. F10 str. 9ZB36]